jgi:hypothetical protein
MHAVICGGRRYTLSASAQYTFSSARQSHTQVAQVMGAVALTTGTDVDTSWWYEANDRKGGP